MKSAIRMMILSSVAVTSIISSNAFASFNTVQAEGEGYIEVNEWHKVSGRAYGRSPETGSYPCRVLRNDAGDIRISFKVDSIWISMNDLDYPLRSNDQYKGISVSAGEIKGVELCKNGGNLQDVKKSFYMTEDVNMTIYNFNLNYSCQTQPKERSGSSLRALCDTRL